MLTKLLKDWVIQILVKTLLNENKILCIPLLFHSDIYIANFQEKCEIISFFANQYSLITNSKPLALLITTEER